MESTDVFELASIGNQTVGPVGRFDPPARSLIKKERVYYLILKKTLLNFAIKGRGLTSEDLFLKWTQPAGLEDNDFLTIPYRFVLLDGESNWGSSRKGRVNKALQAWN